MIIALTGHRPEDCEDEHIVRAKIRAALSEASHSRRETTPPIVISGMAAGVDLWGASEARALGLPVWAARPWAGLQAREEDIELYATIIDYADKVVSVSESNNYEGPWVYHKRNEWMVDNATHMLAYWSGKKKGGTFACLNYAAKVNRPIRNIYDRPPF